MKAETYKGRKLRVRIGCKNDFGRVGAYLKHYGWTED